MADTEDDFDSPAIPGPSMSRKDSGTAKYISKFNPAWKKTISFCQQSANR